jgi:hypothetical protein
MVDEDTTIADGACTVDTLAEVLTAIENEEDIEVAAAKKDAPKTKAKKEEAPEEEEAKPKGKKAAKKEEAKKDIPGVRPTLRSRPYLAGTIIAKHGLAAGVTPAMVAELDELCERPNPKESRFNLNRAWHNINGYKGSKK